MNASIRIRQLGICLVSLLACAEAQPAVNQVQPGAIDKATFRDSEWFTTSTVIDTPYSGAAFVGAGTGLSKITWSLEENYLVARSTRSHVTNSEAQAVTPGAAEAGVIAVYAIESHFDIRRTYNSVTGEEQNVIIENTTDLPWYERSHVRVDWSENLAADNLSTALTGGLGEADIAPVAWEVEDPSDPMAPKFVMNEGDEVYYIDIVNKYLLNPSKTVLEGLGEIPTCMLLFSSHLDCNPGEVAVRTSFLRVEKDHDYQPQEYTEDRMSRFGYFLTSRDKYDRDYGVIADERLRLVNRHNLWKRSHQRDADGAYQDCSDDDDCSEGGSVCDLTLQRAEQLESGACTLPYREREVEPVRYYLSQNFPSDLVVDARSVGREWNRGFSDTVKSLRELECDAHGGDDCADERSRPDSDDVFVVCGNPVSEDDHESCGAPGLEVAIGDLRYSTMVWVGDPHSSSPLGYGPSYADPDTGELISGVAYIFGAGVDTYAAYARDLVALINGDLEEAQLTSNDALGAWISDLRSGRGFEAKPREAHSHAVQLDGQDAHRIADAMSFHWQDQWLGSGNQAPFTPGIDPLWPRLKAAKAAVHDASDSLRLDRGYASLDKLRGTEIERLMTTREMLVAGGHPPQATLDDSTVDMASPLRGMSLQALSKIGKLRDQVGQAQNTCLLRGDFADEGLLGLVREIQREVDEGDGVMQWYGVDYQIMKDGEVDYEAVKSMLRHPIFHGTMAHEVGHTVGLRHNFAGSSDSLNYPDRYWDLRNDGQMRSRAWDPLSQTEIDGRISEYQFSTIMDYGNNFVVSDADGIGKYDRAAIKMGYGDIVEVFENVPDENVQTLGFANMITQVNSLLGPLDLRSLSGLGGGVRVIPYTEFPSLVGGIASLRQRADVRYQDLVEDEMLSTTFETILGEDPETFGTDARVVDGMGRAVVDYQYCGDEFADVQPMCLRYDAGADAYESLMSVVDSYWNYYVFNNFMRQRVGFDPMLHASRTYQRYFAKFETSNLYYSYMRGLGASLGGGGAFNAAEDGFGPFTLGIGAAYSMLTQVLAVPSPGQYVMRTDLEGDNVYTAGLAGSLGGGAGYTVDDFDGRSLFTEYDFGPDQSFWFITKAGYFIDKELAIQTLLDPGRQVLLGQDTTSGDLRQYQISFYTTFEDSLHEVLRGVIGEDWKSYAPRLNGSGLVYPDAGEQQAFTSMEGVPLDPNVDFTLQLYAMAYSMALTPRTFDQSFIDQTRLSVSGGSEQVDLTFADGRSIVSFLDEDSGLTYMAPSYPDDDGRESGIAARALQYAQALRDAGEDAQLASFIDNLDAMRLLTHLYGAGGDPVSVSINPEDGSF